MQLSRNNETLTTLRKGEVFGEAWFLKNRASPTSATVKSATCSLVKLDLDLYVDGLFKVVEPVPTPVPEKVNNHVLRSGTFSSPSPTAKRLGMRVFSSSSLEEAVEFVNQLCSPSESNATVDRIAEGKDVFHNVLLGLVMRLRTDIRKNNDSASPRESSGTELKPPPATFQRGHRR